MLYPMHGAWEMSFVGSWPRSLRAAFRVGVARGFVALGLFGFANFTAQLNADQPVANTTLAVRHRKRISIAPKSGSGSWFRPMALPISLRKARMSSRGPGLRRPCKFA
jgi:hypothetical protein